MLYTVPLLLSLSALISASPVDPSDFSGTGYISIIASNNVSTATPAQKIGCLDTYGKVIVDNGSCGVFTKLAVYPNTLSTSAGNCTFRDNSQEKNTDSLYGKQDDAWSCGGGETGEVGDAMYTVFGFNYPFLCISDYNCYYDAKSTPVAGGAGVPFWEARLGFSQVDVPQGHVEVLLLWEKMQ